MLARFIWAGNGKYTTAHQAFSHSEGWLTYGPLVKWEITISTAKHSAEATVWIPLHGVNEDGSIESGGIRPANNTVNDYGTATINAGDHVFLQDTDSTLFGNTFGGWPILHGTIDSVSYDDQMLKIHFRNPMSWLADQHVREGPLLPYSTFNSNGIFPQNPFGYPELMSVGTVNLYAKYIPNYIRTQSQRPLNTQRNVIQDFIRYLAADYVGGPFIQTIHIDPSAAGDGTLISDNYTTNSNISILNAILDLCSSARWADTFGYGLEVLANPIPFGSGFSTELYLFRRSALPSGFIFDYHGGGTHAVIDYNFPEQTIGVGTGGEMIGTGGVHLGLREIGDKINAVAGNTIATSLINLIFRGSAGLESAGRIFGSTASYQADKDALIHSLVGKLDGVGTSRGLRVGSVRVGGWLDAPINPGYMATVNIPEIGLISEQFTIDEVSYSEPDGITTVYFNRTSGDSLGRHLAKMTSTVHATSAEAQAVVDSGWFRADGNDGNFDALASPDAPMAGKPNGPTRAFRQAGGEVYEWDFFHNLGKQPNVVEIWAGLINNEGTDVAIQSRTRVMELAPDPSQDQWYGASITGNTPTTVTITFASWIAFNRNIDVSFGAGSGWYNMVFTNLYLRVICKP